MYYKEIGISSLIGKTLTSVIGLNSEPIFGTDNGEQYKMYHSQSCCESVGIEDTKGDIDSILNSPILNAIEETEDKWPTDVEKPTYMPESFTWTTFTITTEKGSLIIRWLGESNGYYSEGVSFVKI